MARANETTPPKIRISHQARSRLLAEKAQCVWAGNAGGSTSDGPCLACMQRQQAQREGLEPSAVIEGGKLREMGRIRPVWGYSVSSSSCSLAWSTGKLAKERWGIRKK